MLTCFQKLVPNQGFSFLDFSPGKFPNNHSPFSEPFQVCLLLCFCKLLLVILAFDFHLQANRLSTLIPKLWNLNDGHNLKRQYPLILNPILLPECRFCLQIMQSHVVIRSITRHAGNNPSSFVHQNRQHGKRINDLIKGQRRLQWKSNQRRSMSKHKHLTVIDFKSSILPIRQHPSIGLTIHSLRSQSCSSKKHLLSLQNLKLFGKRRNQLHLDDSVLLRLNSLTTSPIMICTRLTIQRRENSIPHILHNLPNGLQLPHLPPHKGIKIRIHIGPSEIPTLRMISHWRSTGGSFFFLLLLLLFFDFDGEDGRVAEALDLTGEFVGGGFDRHAGAVESEGEEDIGAAEAVEGGGELELGEREGVAEVEVAVHVREGEVAEEFLARRGGFIARFGSEDVFLFPPFLNV
ncbi:hypothetical protein CR513_29137, partial [Mucuna pruriens]